MASEKTKKAPGELWHSRCPVPSPLGIAAQLGWLESALQNHHGIRLESLYETSDPVEAVSYYENPLPNSFRHGGSVPAICARAGGLHTRVIGLTWTDEYQAIIAMPQAGIRTVHDLRGRRVGIPLHDVVIDHSRAAALRGFSAMLATAGMSLADVERVDLPDSEIPAAFKDGAVISTGTGRRGRYSYTNEVRALARGDVDAVYVKDAHGAQVTHLLGALVVANIGAHPDPQVRINNCTPRPLTVSQWLLDEHPDVVGTLLHEVLHAGRWARSHPDEVRTLVGRETGWAENWVRYAYGDALHMNLQLGLEPAWMAALGGFKDFLLTHGFISVDFDISTWVCHEPLLEVLLQGDRRGNHRGNWRQAMLPSSSRPWQGPLH